MTFEETLFTNFLDSDRITPTRLYNFGYYTLKQMMNNNPGHVFDAAIIALTGELLTLQTEISGVDSSLNLQVQKTETNDAVLTNFRFQMSDKEGAIAFNLGGRTTEAYGLMYPDGINEYTVASKEQMPTLTKRVYDVTMANSAALGTVLTGLLKAFQASWTTSHDIQQTQIGVVEVNRSNRGTGYLGLQTGLISIIGLVMYNFPASLLGATYFDWSKLYNPTHHKHVELSGELTVVQHKEEIANYMFKDGDKMTARNTSTNATLRIYLVMTLDAVPVLFLELKAGKVKSFLVSTIGNLAGTFLIIENMSAVNPVTWEVSYTE